MKTIKEINERIKKGEAVVVTADELVELKKSANTKKLAEEIDVVTTGTFGPMCSSGVFLNFGHSKERIKIGGGKVYLNGVPAYSGLAAVDVYIGATALPDDDPRNSKYPGEFKYGGGHVIEDLVSGKEIELVIYTYGTDCYPKKYLKTKITLNDINEAILFDPRNCYQNYNVAVNLSNRTIYTYMGVLKPNLGNANYCSAGQLSPLLKDPYLKTIGFGTRIFLGGGIGYVAWWGTQYNPGVKRRENGIPMAGGATLSLIGDLKQMKSEFLKGASLTGYGTSLIVGIGIPIPILNEDILNWTSIPDEEIYAPIVDYSYDYPHSTGKVLDYVNYGQLKSGRIKIMGKEVSTGSLSSYKKAKEIAEILKNWIKNGEFLLTEPVFYFPGPESAYKFKPMKEV
ncbi:MAG TPA: homocysteine biosynthesis protein [bacterium]|nr:homocysteine biosynthesis protein [bacterium]HOM26798.1 homocysteine biosynthesis protein [bacterium]